MKARNLVATLALVGLVACSDDPTGVEVGELSDSDVQLVASLAAEGDSIMNHHRAGPRSLVRRFKHAVENNGSEEALALLEEAKALREQAREAREAGDTATARDLFQQSGDAFFEAVVLTLPDSPARTGDVVDDVIARFQERIGDRDLPRVQEALEHAIDLRERASEALADGNEVEALQLNVRAGRVLSRIRHRARHHRMGPGDGGPDDGRAVGPPYMDEVDI